MIRPLTYCYIPAAFFANSANAALFLTGSKEEPAQKQQSEHENNCVNNDFDKAHKSLILKRPAFAPSNEKKQF